MSTRLEQIAQRVKAAHREICDLASGKRRWTMCVPVQQDDSDMILQAPLDDLSYLLKLVASLESEVEFLREAAKFYAKPESIEPHLTEGKEKIYGRPGIGMGFYAPARAALANANAISAERGRL